MTDPRLLLCNHYHTDLEINLLQPRGRRLQVFGCRVPAGGAVDVCARLGLSKFEARIIVEASPDYINFHARNRMVELVDPAEQPALVDSREAKRQGIIQALKEMGAPPSGVLIGPPEGMGIEEHQATLDKMFTARLLRPSTPVGGDPSPEAPTEKVMNPVIARMLEEQELGDGPLPELVEETLVEKEAAQPDAVSALDPGVKEALTDNMPSSRWSREKLAEYAKAKGLDVPDDMSKNAILRKLRGV